MQFQMPDASVTGRVECAHRDPRVILGDQENLRPRIGFGWNEESVGDRSVADLSSRAGELEAVAVCGCLYRALAHLAVERHREDLLAVDRGRRPLLLQRLGAELRQRARAEHDRLQVRHCGELATQRHQHRDLLEHSETAASQGFRRGGGKDVGLDQLAPQVAVEALLEPVELPLVLGRADRFGDGAGQAAQIVEGLWCLEIHDVPYRLTLGRPSATIPMMSR